MTSKPHSRLDGDDPRIEYISRAMDYVPLKLYDEIQRPAEEAVAELIHEHNGLLEQFETLRSACASLEAEGWFAAWSDDPRVRTIRGALNPAKDYPHLGPGRCGNCGEALDADHSCGAYPASKPEIRRTPEDELSDGAGWLDEGDDGYATRKNPRETYETDAEAYPAKDSDA